MDKFAEIYKNRLWACTDNESLSGDGSSKNANRLRNIFLSEFINNNTITHVYDICGDCNWQSDFVDLVTNKQFTYFGFDVCEDALKIAKDKNKFNTSMRFSDTPIDLCETVLDCKNGDTSLIIIKEVIQHLPLEHGVKMLKNIKQAGIKYIAITHHDKFLFNAHTNNTIEIGEFYPNNMFLPPFNFKNPINDINDTITNYIDKKMYGNLIIFNIQEQDL